MGVLWNPLRRLGVSHTSTENVAERLISSFIPLLSEPPDVVKSFVVDLKQTLQGASLLQEMQ